MMSLRQRWGETRGGFICIYGDNNIIHIRVIFNIVFFVRNTDIDKQTKKVQLNEVRINV